MIRKNLDSSPLILVSLVAFTVLFIELLIIRVVTSEISIFAYLQNAILVSCFLALGMGLIVGKDILVRSSLAPLALLTACCYEPSLAQGGHKIAQYLSVFHDFPVWNQPIFINGNFIPLTLGLLGTFAYLFVVWAILIPLGAELGRQLDRAPTVNRGYSADIFGSLCGVIAFSILSYYSTPPVVWLWIATLLLLLLSTPSSLRKIDWIAACIIVLLPLANNVRGSNVITVWSPYQKLEAQPAEDDPTEWIISTNNAGLQQIQNSKSPNLIAPNPVTLPQLFSQYDLPGYIAKGAARVLVVGAGTGNDVAGVLRQLPNASITAVELDPELISIGSRLNADAPYSAPNVKVILNDARAFFDTSTEKFDLIVFGLLDSHTTPNISNARLDNFVYTQNGINRARSLLKADGMLFLIFQIQRAYIAERLSKTLTSAFGGIAPRAFDISSSPYGWGGTTFVAGNLTPLNTALTQDSALREYLLPLELPPTPPEHSTIAPTTDDWPYLYIKEPSIPSLFVVLGAILTSLWLLTSFLAERRIVIPNFYDVGQRHFFCMGAAFSLMQVFLLARTSVMFGSTWFVNTVVSIGILVGILIANQLSVFLSRSAVRAVWILLVATSAAYAMIPSLSTSEVSSIRFLLGLSLCALPTLLSGLLFAHTFSSVHSPSKALGANLFGALIGAILQLLSFKFGIGSLAFGAAGFYVLAGLWLPATSNQEEIVHSKV